MELDEACRELAAALGVDTNDLPHGVPQWADLLHVVRVIVERSDTISRRAQQIRGGLKPYARPPEVVDFLLAEPEGS